MLTPEKGLGEDPPKTKNINGPIYMILVHWYCIVILMQKGPIKIPVNLTLEERGVSSNVVLVFCGEAKWKTFNSKWCNTNW